MFTFTGLFLGYRDNFLTKEEIVKYISKSLNYKSNIEGIDNANAILIFDTSKQKTWLVATNERLYCILDDIRESEPHINWSMSKQKLISNNSLKISISAKEKSKDTGLVDIGETHKGWLYSKKLFPLTSIEDTIKRFILSQMVNGGN